MRRLMLAGAALPLLFWGAAPVLACEGRDRPCRIGDRTYHVRLPDDWDGATRMPVLVHFHGWGRNGAHVLGNRRVAGAARRRGVLLVAPTGLGGSWSFRTAGSQDVAFARAVLDEIRARYPVGPVFVSGYSWGSAMAWRFACEDGQDIDALLAVSGTLPQDTRCATAPREVRQVHGLKDDVLGYPLGPDGETDWPVKLWRDAHDCGAGRETGDWSQVPFLTLTRRVWEDCAGGRVTLDTHPGGHFIPHGWIARQLDELLGLTPRYP